MTAPVQETAADVAGYVDQLIGASFTAENTDRQAGRDPTRMTMSWIGGCTRAAAYSLAGQPATDVHPPEEARAAVLGTWMHDKLFPRMATTGGGAIVEKKITLTGGGVTLDGSLDMVQLRRLGAPLNLVWEGKSVNSWRMQGVLRHDAAYNAHWLQAVGYGWGCYQTGGDQTGGDQTGEDVDWVTWLYLHRERGDVSRYVSRFNKYATGAVEERLREVAYWSENPDKAPREIATVGGRHREDAALRGPGMAMACNRCPWLSRCWPGAEPGKKGGQRALATEPGGVERALELYESGRTKESEGRKDKEFGAAILDGVPHGQYGQLVYSHGQGAWKEDVEWMRNRLTELGETIPKKQTAAPISVKRAAQET